MSKEKVQIMIKTSDLVNSDLWRLFPAIEVSKTKDIPCDYPGAMGVPITAWDKLCLDRRFQLLDSLRPKIGNRTIFQRFIIRNLQPDLPEEVDLADLLRRSGSKYEIIIRNEQ